MINFLSSIFQINYFINNFHRTDWSVVLKINIYFIIDFLIFYYYLIDRYFRIKSIYIKYYNFKINSDDCYTNDYGHCTYLDKQ